MLSPLRTIVQMIQKFDTLRGVSLTFTGTPPTARDIHGMMPPKSQLMARDVSATLVSGGGFKGKGTYVGVMPVGSAQLEPAEKLEVLVAGLRIFFVGHNDRDAGFTFEELVLATPEEVREAQEEAAELAKGQAKTARCKKNLHHYFDHLFSALAVLVDRSRNDLPQCNGNCSYGTCKYTSDNFIWTCDTEGIDPLDVLKQVTATNS